MSVQLIVEEEEDPFWFLLGFFLVLGWLVGGVGWKNGVKPRGQRKYYILHNKNDLL